MHSQWAATSVTSLEKEFHFLVIFSPEKSRLRTPIAENIDDGLSTVSAMALLNESEIVQNSWCLFKYGMQNRDFFFKLYQTKTI